MANRKDPSKASQKDFEELGLTGLDNYDDGISDLSSEFDGELEDSSKDRKPVSKIAKVGEHLRAAGEGVATGVVTGIGQEFDKTFPKAKEAVDDIMSTVATADMMRHDFVNKLRPTINQTRIITNRALALAKDVIPEGIYNRLTNFIKPEEAPESRAPSKEEVRSREVSDQLANIFTAQEKIASVERRQSKANEIIHDRIAEVRHSQIAGLINTQVNQSVFQTNFYRGPFTAYLKKSLELKFRHIYLSEDILATMKVQTSMLEKQLDSIRHNTALPDAQKISLSEISKQKMKEKFLGWAGGHVKDFAKKLQDRIQKEYLDPFVESIGNVNDMLDALITGIEMENELGGGGGFSPTKSIAGWIGSGIGGGLGKMGMRQIINALPADVKAMITATSQHASTKAMDALNAFARDRSYEMGIKGKLATFLSGILENPESRYELENTQANDLRKAGQITNQFIKTVEQVIPTYLSIQTKYLAKIAGDNEGAQTDLTWDWKAGRMSTKSKVKNKLIEQAYVSTEAQTHQIRGITEELNKNLAASGALYKSYRHEVDKNKKDKNGNPIDVATQVRDYIDKNRADIGKFVLNVAELGPNGSFDASNGDKAKEYIAKMQELAKMDNEDIDGAREFISDDKWLAAAFEGISNPVEVADIVTSQMVFPDGSYDQTGISLFSNLTLEAREKFRTVDRSAILDAFETYGTDMMSGMLDYDEQHNKFNLNMKRNNINRLNITNKDIDSVNNTNLEEGSIDAYGNIRQYTAWDRLIGKDKQKTVDDRGVLERGLDWIDKHLRDLAEFVGLADNYDELKQTLKEAVVQPIVGFLNDHNLNPAEWPTILADKAKNQILYFINARIDRLVCNPNGEDDSVLGWMLIRNLFWTNEDATREELTDRNTHRLDIAKQIKHQDSDISYYKPINQGWHLRTEPIDRQKFYTLLFGAWKGSSVMMMLRDGIKAIIKGAIGNKDMDEPGSVICSMIVASLPNFIRAFVDTSDEALEGMRELFSSKQVEAELRSVRHEGHKESMKSNKTYSDVAMQIAKRHKISLPEGVESLSDLEESKQKDFWEQVSPYRGEIMARYAALRHGETDNMSKDQRNALRKHRGKLAKALADFRTDQNALKKKIKDAHMSDMSQDELWSYLAYDKDYQRYKYSADRLRAVYAGKDFDWETADKKYDAARNVLRIVPKAEAGKVPDLIGPQRPQDFERSKRFVGAPLPERIAKQREEKSRQDEIVRLINSISGKDIGEKLKQVVTEQGLTVVPDANGGKELSNIEKAVAEILENVDKLSDKNMQSLVKNINRKYGLDLKINNHPRKSITPTKSDEETETTPKRTQTAAEKTSDIVNKAFTAGNKPQNSYPGSGKNNISRHAVGTAIQPAPGTGLAPADIYWDRTGLESDYEPEHLARRRWWEDLGDKAKHAFAGAKSWVNNTYNDAKSVATHTFDKIKDILHPKKEQNQEQPDTAAEKTSANPSVLPMLPYIPQPDTASATAAAANTGAETEAQPQTRAGKWAKWWNDRKASASSLFEKTKEKIFGKGKSLKEKLVGEKRIVEGLEEAVNADGSPALIIHIDGTFSGIVQAPTMIYGNHLVGEHGDEAVIPLKDGRTIILPLNGNERSKQIALYLNNIYNEVYAQKPKDLNTNKHAEGDEISIIDVLKNVTDKFRGGSKNDAKSDSKQQGTAAKSGTTEQAKSGAKTEASKAAIETDAIVARGYCGSAGYVRGTLVWQWVKKNYPELLKGELDPNFKMTDEEAGKYFYDASILDKGKRFFGDAYEKGKDAVNRAADRFTDDVTSGSWKDWAIWSPFKWIWRKLKSIGTGLLNLIPGVGLFKNAEGASIKTDNKTDTKDTAEQKTEEVKPYTPFNQMFAKKDLHSLLEKHLAVTMEIRDNTKRLASRKFLIATLGEVLGDTLSGIGHVIKGGFKIWGNILSGSAHLAGSVVRGGVDAIKNIGFGKEVAAGVSSFFNLTPDVYVADAEAPNGIRLLVAGVDIRAGKYAFANGKRVKSSYDIDEPIYNVTWTKTGEVQMGEIAITEDHIRAGLLNSKGERLDRVGGMIGSRLRKAVNSVTSLATNIVTLPLRLIQSPFKILSGVAKWAFKSKNPYIDVYVIRDKDDIPKVMGHPAMYGARIQRGEYFFTDGEVVKSAYGIEHAVYERVDGEDRIVVSEEDANEGRLYGLRNGKFYKLTQFAGRSIAGKALSLAMGGALRLGKLALKGAQGIGKLLLGGAKAIGKFFSGVANAGTEFMGYVYGAFAGALKAIFPTPFINRQDLEEIVGNRLLDIYGLLYKRLPDKSPVAGDKDGDGDRDGSWEDYKEQSDKRKRKRQEKAEAEKKRKAEEQAHNEKLKAAAAATGAEGESADDDDGMDWMDYYFMGEMFKDFKNSKWGKRIGKAGSMVGKAGKKVLAPVTWAGSKLMHTKAGAKVAAKAKGATAAAKAGFSKMVAKGGAATVAAKAGIGKLATKLVATGVGRVLAATAASIWTGPGAAAVAIATTVYTIGDIAFQLASYLYEDSQDEKDWDSLRMRAYGIDDTLLSLAKKLEDRVIGAIDGEKPQFADADIEAWAAKFGMWDPEKEDVTSNDVRQRIRFWYSWYMIRFLPFFYEYVTIIDQATDREPGDDLDPDDIPEESQNELMQQYKQYCSKLLGESPTVVKLAPTMTAYLDFMEEEKKKKEADKNYKGSELIAAPEPKTKEEVEEQTLQTAGSQARQEREKGKKTTGLELDKGASLQAQLNAYALAEKKDIKLSPEEEAYKKTLLERASLYAKLSQTDKLKIAKQDYENTWEGLRLLGYGIEIKQEAFADKKYGINHSITATILKEFEEKVGQPRALAGREPTDEELEWYGRKLGIFPGGVEYTRRGTLTGDIVRWFCSKENITSEDADKLKTMSAGAQQQYKAARQKLIMYARKFLRDWYKIRFEPVYKTYVYVVMTASGRDIKDIEDMDPEEIPVNARDLARQSIRKQVDAVRKLPAAKLLIPTPSGFINWVKEQEKNLKQGEVKASLAHDGLLNNKSVAEELETRAANRNVEIEKAQKAADEARKKKLEEQQKQKAAKSGVTAGDTDANGAAAKAKSEFDEIANDPDSYLNKILKEHGINTNNPYGDIDVSDLSAVGKKWLKTRFDQYGPGTLPLRKEIEALEARILEIIDGGTELTTHEYDNFAEMFGIIDRKNLQEDAKDRMAYFTHWVDKIVKPINTVYVAVIRAFSILKTGKPNPDLIAESEQEKAINMFLSRLRMYNFTAMEKIIPTNAGYEYWKKRKQKQEEAAKKPKTNQQTVADQLEQQKSKSQAQQAAEMMKNTTVTTAMDEDTRKDQRKREKAELEHGDKTAEAIKARLARKDISIDEREELKSMLESIDAVKNSYTRQGWTRQDGQYVYDPSKKQDKASASDFSNVQADTTPVAPGEIGTAVAKEESGGKGPEAIGWDRGGGTSYGTYQIATKGRSNTMPEFLAFAKKNGGEFGKKFAEAMYAAQPWDTGSRKGPPVDVWLKAAKEQPEALKRLEHDFIKSSKYDAAYKRLNEEAKEQVDANRGTQEAVWSMAVQHGQGGGAKLFNSVDANKDPDDYLRAVYEKRNQKYSGLTSRFKRELAMVLQMNHQSQPTIPYAKNANVPPAQDGAPGEGMGGDAPAGVASEQKAERAADIARSQARARSTGFCARFTRNALEKAGIPLPRRGSAWMFAEGPLQQAGFQEIDPNTPSEKGDVAILTRTAQHQHGHAEIFDGNSWVSDFKQSKRPELGDPEGIIPYRGHKLTGGQQIRKFRAGGGALTTATASYNPSNGAYTNDDGVSTPSYNGPSVYTDTPSQTGRVGSAIAGDLNLTELKHISAILEAIRGDLASYNNQPKPEAVGGGVDDSMMASGDTGQTPMSQVNRPATNLASDSSPSMSDISSSDNGSSGGASDAGGYGGPSSASVALSSPINVTKDWSIANA